MGFIQVYQPFRSATYVGQPAFTTTFSPPGTLWDGVDRNSTAVWYSNRSDFGYWKVPKGNTLNLSNSGYTPPYVNDSPYQWYPPQTSPNNRLQSITIDESFQTSVAVMGGWNPNNGLKLGGIPIALSTAWWWFSGSATTTAKTVQDVLDINQWTPGSVAFSPDQVENYLGDNLIRFLQWDGNGPMQLSADNFQGSAGNMDGGMGTSPWGSAGLSPEDPVSRDGGVSVAPSIHPRGLESSRQLAVDPNRFAVLVIPPRFLESTLTLKPSSKRKSR